MKFRGGDLVEVLRNTDFCESWIPARIVSAFKDKFSVNLELISGAYGKPIIEKVSKQHVRPQPPAVRQKRRWISGDILEALDCQSWKPGKVAKVLGNDWFVIKIIGTIQLKEFHSSNLRVWQTWQDNQWVTNDKDCKDLLFSIKKSKFNLRTLESNLRIGDVVGNVKKNKCTLQHFTNGKLPKDTRHVDALSCTKSNGSEKCMHLSLHPNKFGSSRKEMKIFDEGMHTIYSLTLPLEAIGENDECSVASCSSNCLAKSTAQTSWSFRYAEDSNFDAESSCPFKPGKDDVDDNIHKLELHAYQSTVQAFYASGPLSWEQETLLTNLRLSLHISNEEHLLQVRSLLSSPLL